MNLNTKKLWQEEKKEKKGFAFVFVYTYVMLIASRVWCKYVSLKV